MKPIIIAITGPSCAGKDTLMRQLFYEFSARSDLFKSYPDAHYIISCTTRPPRRNEKIDEDYHFITDEQFKQCIENDTMLEWAEFRGWFYGTPQSSIDMHPKAINIGVFNLQGIESLNKLQDQYFIIPIYLIVNWKERLRRSIKREGHLTLEMIRRLWTDHKDFKHPHSILGQTGNLLAYASNYDIDVVIQDIVGKIK